MQAEALGYLHHASSPGDDATHRDKKVDMRTQQAAPSRGGTNLALATLFLGMFVLGSAELLVVGVLNLIAADLRVSIPAAGALVTANALGLAVGGPILTALTIKLNKRTVLAGTLILFALGMVPSLQYRVVSLAGPGAQLASALPASAINMGIAFGSAAGGLAIGGHAASAAVLTGLIIAGIAIPVAWATSYLKPPVVKQTTQPAAAAQPTRQTA
jgi:MFS transporter, DHA1 family, inner membrane transport protein